LILYCHTYSGNKTEGKFLFQYLPLDFDLALFDFAGCGNSPDAYLTYGHKEKFDINNMLKHIEETYEYSEYYVWGRSMGAVVTSLFAQNFISKQNQEEKNKENSKSVDLKENEIVENNHLTKIKGLVLDSPFTKLFTMIQGNFNFQMY
jgi:alpha-beta hydrolase superfamily lysophospholipase